MKKKNLIFISIYFLFSLFNSQIIYADLNSDDYNEIISYLVNPNVSNSNYVNWAKNILLKDTAAIPYLIEHLNSVNSRTIWEIRNLLIEIGKPAVPFLSEYISDTQTTGNLTAIEVLGEIGDSSAAVLDKLLELLNSQYPAVRNITAIAVGRMPAEKSVSKLLPLTKDSVDMVRKSAIVSIGKIAPAAPAVIKELLCNLNDTYFYQRFSAVEAIQKFDTAIVINQILEKINSTTDTHELTMLFRIISPFSISDIDKFEIIKKIFLESNDELISEYALKIIVNSTAQNKEYIEKFKKKFNRNPILVKCNDK